MICNIYLLKNHEIANNSTTSKFGEKKSTDLESVGFQKNFDAGLIKFKNNIILLNGKEATVNRALDGSTYPS